MTALGKIRSKGILLIIIIGLGLFAFIAEEAFRSCNGIKGQNSQQIGEVLGEKIYVQDFQKLLEEYQDAMKLTMRTDNLSEDQLNQLKDQVWQQLVSERVMKEDCKKLGLTVTEDELQNVLNDGTNQLLTQTPFVNQQTGRFDVSILKQFIDAYRKAEASDRPTMIHIETDLMGPNPPGSSWWDVPVSQVSALESTQRAYEDYQRDRKLQRHYL